MAGFIDEVLDAYRTTVERHRNRPFLKAAMAGCALAATASGEVTFSQRIRVDQVLETLERLEVFDPHEGVELFNEYCDGILASSRAGHEAATAAIAPFVGDRDSAALLVRICLAVADAGGEKSLTQEIEVVMLCSLLGLDPDGAGLYTDIPPAAGEER